MTCSYLRDLIRITATYFASCRKNVQAYSRENVTVLSYLYLVQTLQAAEKYSRIPLVRTRVVQIIALVAKKFLLFGWPNIKNSQRRSFTTYSHSANFCIMT